MKVERCYKEEVFVPRIEKALGVSLPRFTCHIVDQSGMGKVMNKAGWNKSQSKGVVGFHLNQNIYVLDSAPWTTLHELVHRAGVNADRLNRFIAEGLTELIAAKLKTGPDEHRATYPTERAWVKNFLLPKLGMSELELGSFIAKSKSPSRDLAKLIREKGISNKPLSELAHSLRGQAPNKPSFNIQSAATRKGNDKNIVPPLLCSIAAFVGVFLFMSAGNPKDTPAL